MNSHTNSIEAQCLLALKHAASSNNTFTSKAPSQAMIADEKNTLLYSHSFFQKPKTSLSPKLEAFLRKIAHIESIAHPSLEDRVYLTAHYLWQHSDSLTRIEVVTPDTYFHPIIIVDRKGFLNEPSTWREKIMFIDVSMGENGVLSSYEQLVKTLQKSSHPEYYSLKSQLDISPNREQHPKATHVNKREDENPHLRPS